MISNMKRSVSVWLALAIAIFSIAQCRAQNGEAFFGTIYMANNYQSTATVDVYGTEAIYGNFSGGGGTQLSVGSVSVPQYISLYGEGQDLHLPVTLTSNGASGDISGGFTATYTCEGYCTQPTLSIYVTLSGNSIVASTVAGVKYFTLSILYNAPGNASSSGFSNSVSEGTSTSISQIFQTSTV